MAEWPSGKAGVCKTPYNGSNPFSRLSTKIFFFSLVYNWLVKRPCPSGALLFLGLLLPFVSIDLVQGHHFFHGLLHSVC
jgi:hypothetical protein